MVRYYGSRKGPFRELYILTGPVGLSLTRDHRSPNTLICLRVGRWRHSWFGKVWF